MSQTVEERTDGHSSEGRWASLTKDQKFGLKLILPAFTLMAIVHGFPIVMGFVMSFYKFPSLDIAEWFRPETFVALTHYIDIFEPETFIGSQIVGSMKATLIYTVGCVTGVFTLGMIAALALNHDFRGKLAARTAILVPWVVPIVPMLLTWRMMLAFDGSINGLLLMTPFFDSVQSLPQWLLGPNSLLTIIITNIWRQFPWAAIMLYAGLQSIPQQLYEAADIDGASRWGKFRHVTLPQLMPVSTVILLLMILWTLVNFTIPYILLGSQPSESANVLIVLAYNAGFSQSQYGAGAAISFLLFIIAMIFAYVYYKRTVQGEYQGGAI
ncbi:carbohydrate ABC transporter permease [Halorhabdus sp. CUG00001]|uniref:carbohydrate ABC transporter permease n=1 Tax=Halorhabdus sp. CUG00001 TaxID=2600297 RepID=UPI0018EF06EA|nr:sugar ABC transporter permease [Halorhabdus sp. CUG00001]